MLNDWIDAAAQLPTGDDVGRECDEPLARRPDRCRRAPAAASTGRPAPLPMRRVPSPESAARG
jgi:hypothetical protein